MGRPVEGPLCTFDASVATLILQWRAAHPGWGPTTLHVELQRHNRSQKPPSRASIGRFLKENKLTHSYEPHAGVAEPPLKKTEHPHQRWQLDGEGNRRIEAVGTVAILNVKDVHSRTYTGSYPALLGGLHNHPTTEHYRSALRLAFTEFGLPVQIQTDHASVFYDNSSASPFPTQLHLWLAALGIELCFSRVKRPTDQGQVERSHQMMVAQVIEGASFLDWHHLAQCMTQRRRVLNEFYPCASLGGQAPWQAYPQARHSLGDYAPEQEIELLDLQRAHALIAQGTYFRKTSKCKSVRLGGHTYHIGPARPWQQLCITFEASTKELLFQDEKEQMLTTIPIKGIDTETLIGPLWPYRQLPDFQLPLPLDWRSHITTEGIRLFETLDRLRLSET